VEEKIFWVGMGSEQGPNVLSCSTNNERRKGVLDLSGAGEVQPNSVPMIISDENSGMHRTRGQDVSVVEDISS
jgi:hypothetical protein